MSKSAHLPKTEFVILMALMTSLIAFSIDSMLPAFPEISSTFGVSEADKLQMIIAMLFLGFGIGQLIFGQLSDVFGRKAPIYWGIAIFLVGSIMAGFASNFEVFIFGRFLQGVGASAPRIISLALIRDEYSGNAMAQITSLVMTIFILVPAVAPTLGQIILFFSNWRAIFIVLFSVGVALLIWFGLRQTETLPKESRRNFNYKQFTYGLKQTFSQSTTVVCMIVSGMVFGIFIGYLGAVQEIFEKIFYVKKMFPMYFAILAISIGAASFFNSKLVMVLGMRRLIFYAFTSMAILSNLFALYLYFFQHGAPTLWVFMVYMALTFFSVGFLFGNLNALSMQPVGHVAGIASSLIGFVQSAIAVVIGILLGSHFHNGITPLVVSFGTISILCIAVLSIEHQFRKYITINKPL